MSFRCWLYFLQGHGPYFYYFSTFVSTMSIMLDMPFILYFTIRNALFDIFVLSRFNQKMNTKIIHFGSDFQLKFNQNLAFLASKMLHKTTSTKLPIFYRFFTKFGPENGSQNWSQNGSRNSSRIIKFGCRPLNFCTFDHLGADH